MDNHQTRPELGSDHSEPPLRVELQQVSPQDDRQCDEEKEDQGGESREEKKLLIAVGTDEFEIERCLQYENSQQQERPHS